MSITPPYTSKIQSVSKPEHIQPKTEILNEYIRDSSVLICSLWLNPTNVIEYPLTKPTDYESFLKEVLKRSRCSLHVLQLSMFYLFKLQKLIKDRFVNEQKSLYSPKKVFLICLILGFKFSFDSSYKFKTWSKISGLTVKELQSLEFSILTSLNYELNISKEDYTLWTSHLEKSLEIIGARFNIKAKRAIEEDTVSPTVKRVKV